MSNPFIKIGDRYIGKDYKPFVIAEVGINHGGSLQVAMEIVDSAHNSGAEVIKHQTHIVDAEMSAKAKSIIPSNAEESIYDLMKKCALSEEDEYKLKQYVEGKGMTFLSTPFSIAAADRLEKMNVQAYKIGSGECNNYPLIEHVCQFRKPIILSTGMNDLESIKKAANIMEGYGVPYALLHCTNIYPTPPELVRLGGMQELMREFHHVPVGLSDHTLNNNACYAAAALGACILERHYVDTRKRTGPDVPCSMDQEDLRELINNVNEIYTMLGGKKEAAKEEKGTIDFAFATVVALRDIQKGEIFTCANIGVKRPNSGEIKAEHFQSLLGKKSKNMISQDTHIRWEDIVD